MASPDFDPYAVLGVPLHATPDEIRSACRQPAAACHPDIQLPDKKAWASERMIQLNTARDLLLDPRRRAQYPRGQAGAPRPRAEKNRWREQAAQAAYASARRRQAAPAAAQAPAGAVLQFRTTLINVGHSRLAAREVVCGAGLLAFILLRWSRRRKP